VAQIWIVEDDEDIREIVMYSLQSANFTTHGFESGDGFFSMLETTTPDLVILDIMLPGDDGLQILQKLRKKHPTIPVMMLTAKTSEFDKVKGLDLGADDYLSKPFGVMELLSRVRALLRRSKFETTTSTDETLTYENIRMNHQTRAVFVDDAEVVLTFKEYELLHYLLLNKGLVLNREKILEIVWGFDYEGESHTLYMHIKSLRQKLGGAGEHIKTLRNVGYKLGV